MISYYPNMGNLNEMFDREVFYKEGDPIAEAQAQAIYEVCVKIYNAGYGAGMCKMADLSASLLREIKRRAE